MPDRPRTVPRTQHAQRLAARQYERWVRARERSQEHAAGRAAPHSGTCECPVCLRQYGARRSAP